jgi:hypothetical protein
LNVTLSYSPEEEDELLLEPSKNRTIYMC